MQVPHNQWYFVIDAKSSRLLKKKVQKNKAF